MSRSKPFNRRTLIKASGAAGILSATSLAMSTPTLASTPVASPVTSNLESSITTTMEAMEIPGATVLVEQEGSAPWIHSFGVADTEANKPMDPAMHMRIGSVTKTMTAAVVLQLVDEGKLSLDDTLAAAMPEISAFPYADEMTIRQMLGMRSGAFDYLGDPSVFQGIVQDPTRSWTPDELIDTSLANEPAFAPGEGFAYSNTNYILLGMIVEKVTGQPIAETFRQRLFDPLGMAQTSLPDDAEMTAPYARGYGVEVTFSGATPVPQLTDELKDWTRFNPTVAWAAGGVVSTIGDLRIWLEEVAQGSLLSDQLQRERMTFPEIGSSPDAPPFRYGLGVASFDGMIGHDGSIFGYEAFVGRDQDTGMSIITLINVSPSPANASAFGLATAVRETLAQG
jgi:D-alanyl-D-alanine carboxypeptidase